MGSMTFVLGYSTLERKQEMLLNLEKGNTTHNNAQCNDELKYISSERIRERLKLLTVVEP